MGLGVGRRGSGSGDWGRRAGGSALGTASAVELGCGVAGRSGGKDKCGNRSWREGRGEVWGLSGGGGGGKAGGEQSQQGAWRGAGGCVAPKGGQDVSVGNTGHGRAGLGCVVRAGSGCWAIQQSWCCWQNRGCCFPSVRDPGAGGLGSNEH